MSESKESPIPPKRAKTTQPSVRDFFGASSASRTCFIR